MNDGKYGNEWMRFEQTGGVAKYLAYKNLVKRRKFDLEVGEEVGTFDDEDQGDSD